MIYKIDPEKKKEFESFNFKQAVKHIFPIFIPAIIFMDVIMGFVLADEYASMRPFIVYILLFSNLFSVIVFFISAFIGVKTVSSKLETWELSVEENYALLKNSIAATTVNFANFKKYKKNE